MTTTTPDTNTTWTWLLTTEELHATQKKIEKINQRATRRGFTGHIEINATQTTQTTKSPSGLPVTEIAWETTITGEAPKYNGWTLLGALTWDEHAGLVVRTVPGINSVDRTNLHEGWCDHCRSRRHRINTYLVGHDDGRQLQVGSTCLKDFLGWEANPVILIEKDIKDDIDAALDSTSIDRTPTYSTETVLAAAWAVVTRNGYVRSGEFNSTKELVSMLLNPRTTAEEKAAREYAPYITEAVGKADELRDFLLSDEFSGNSEYVINLKAIAAAGWVDPRNLGLLVSAPQAYARAQEQSLIRMRDAAEIRDEHYGGVGEKVEIQVRVKAVTWTSGRYGTTTIYTLISDTGHLFKWFASRDALGEDVTEEYTTLRGTIKDHSVWQGRRETRLTRCKPLSI